MRLFIALLLVTASFSLAQSFSGTYSARDETGETISLTLEQKPDGSLEGNLMLTGMQIAVRGKVTGANTATGEFVPEAGDTNPPYTFTLQLEEPQLLFTDTDTGDVLTLSRGTAPTTQTQPTEDSQTSLPDDPKLQECMTFLESDEAATNQAKVQECQTYIQTVLGSSGEGDEDSDMGTDPEELAYCQDFLADAEAVADDPEEKAYCEDYVKTYGATQPQANPTTTENNPLNPPVSNSLDSKAQNPLTAPADALSGIYRGENIALTLQAANGQYTGTLEFNSQTYPVQAAEQKGKVAGTFQANGSPFDFAFYPQDDFFVLESGGQKYNLMKQP